MKGLLIIIFNCLSFSISAQDFNSAKKTRSLVQVKVCEYSIVNTTPKIEDAVPIVLPDSEMITNDVQEREKKNSPPLLTSFSKPLISLYKTSSFGLRFHPILKKWRFHSGVDFASNADTVYSILAGRIKSSGHSPTLGYYIRTEHFDGKIEVLYAHLSQYHHRERQNVLAGEPIGITGNTGISTGDHLHLAVCIEKKYVDPIEFMHAIVKFNKLLTKPQVYQTSHD